jgi:hypothetical protein
VSATTNTKKVATHVHQFIMIRYVTTRPWAAPSAIVQHTKHCRLQVILRIVIQTCKGRINHAVARCARPVELTPKPLWWRLSNRIVHGKSRQVLQAEQTQESSKSRR